jgi:hypothetical protein
VQFKAPPPPPEPIGFSGKKKVCATCEKNIAVEMFYSAPHTKDQLTYMCIPCTQAWNRAYRSGQTPPTSTVQKCKVCGTRERGAFAKKQARVCNQCKAERGKYYNRTAKERYAKRKAQKNGNCVEQ